MANRTISLRLPPGVAEQLAAADERIVAAVRELANARQARSDLIRTLALCEDVEVDVRESP